MPTTRQKKLKELEMPVPEADQSAVARMKWEKENRRKASLKVAQHRVPEARSGCEYCRPSGRSRDDHHAAFGSATGSADRRGRRAAPGDVTAHHRRKFLGARYQARCASQSASARRCGRGPLPRAPAAAASTGSSADSPGSQRNSLPPIANAKKKKKNKKQQPQPATAPTTEQPAAAQPAAAQPVQRQPPRPELSRILLADDSPHAQRMGERILREEGFEVVSLTDGDAAMPRLADVDPDLILADVFLPGKSGFELCRYVKNDPRFRHVRVVLTAGLLEPFDEDEAKRAGCDAILKKPFEASKVVETIHPLGEGGATGARAFRRCTRFRASVASRTAQASRAAAPLLKSIPNAFAPPSRSPSTPPCPP